MASDKTITLTLKVNDQGTVSLQKFSGEVKKAGENIDKMGKALSFIKVDAIVNLFSRGVGAIKGFVEFLDIGAKAKQTEESFMLIAKSSGIMGEQLIKDIKTASGVFVDETDIMLKAQRALNEGISGTDIVKLTEASRMAARMMGVDVKDAFEGVMEAVITLRTRGIKAAFPMDQEEVIKDFAKSINATSEELTDLGKRQAIINEIYRQYNEILATTGELQENQAEQIQKLKSAADEFQESLSKGSLAALETTRSSLDWLMGQAALYVLELEKSTKKAEGLADRIKKAAVFITNPLLAFGLSKASKPEAASVTATAAAVATASAAVNAPSGNWPSEARYVQSYTNAVIAAAEATKKLVDPVKQLDNAYKALGIVSKKAMDEQVSGAARAITILEKVKAPVEDLQKSYVSLYDKMEKMRPRDLSKETIKIHKDEAEKRMAIEDEYTAGVKALNEKYPDRGQEYSKELNRLIEENLKALRQVSEEASKLEFRAKLELDTSFAKDQIQTLKNDLQTQGVIFPPETLGLLQQITGQTTLFKDEILTIKTETMSLVGEFELVLSKLKEIKGIGSQVVSIDIKGKGSTEKPIMDKIQEIVNGFGGLQNAVSGIEARINFLGVSSELTVLQQKLRVTESMFPGIADMVQMVNGMMEINQNMPLWMQQAAIPILEIKTQMEQLRLQKLSYQMKMGEGEYQSGTWRVPQTGLYTLHEDERVSRKGVDVGGITVQINAGNGTPTQIADAVAKAIKFKLSGKLEEALRKP